MSKNTQLFKAEVEFVKSEGERRIVRGFASTENLDQQGEEILQNGLDFSPLLKSGFLNYDHQGQCLSCGQVFASSACPNCGSQGKMPIIVGYPHTAERVQKGWIVEGELLRGDDPNPTSLQLKLANELWEVGLALQKSSNRRLAYSVEGKAVERRGQKIVKAIVSQLAVTHKPVNAECTIEMLRKSLCCGNCDQGGHRCSHGIEKALSTESAAPLMRENLHGGVGKVLYGASNCECFDRETGRFAKGAAGALNHLTGCLGQPKDIALRFMRGLVKGSVKRPDIAALVRQAGIAG